MSLRLPSKHYDDLYARARIARVTVPELVRQELERVRRARLRVQPPVKVSKVEPE